MWLQELCDAVPDPRLGDELGVVINLEWWVWKSWDLDFRKLLCGDGLGKARKEGLVVNSGEGIDASNLQDVSVYMAG